MIGASRSFSLDKAIGLSIGFLIGVIPLAEYNVPVLIILMSVVFGIKHVDRQAVKAAFPIILYCVSMIGFMIYHPGWLEYDHTLATILATIALAAVPMVAMFKTYVGSLERCETAALVGLLTIFTIMAYQYFVLDGCRVKAFSVNPLGPPITFLPFGIYIISLRAFAQRFNYIDSLVLTALVITLSIFSGARAAFYSLVILSTFLTFSLLLKHKIKQGLMILTCLAVGIMGAKWLDKCHSFSRMSTHLKMINIIIPEKKVILGPSKAFEENTDSETTKLTGAQIKDSYKIAQADQSEMVLTNTQNTNPGKLDLLERVEPDSSGYRVLLWRKAAAHILSFDNPSQIFLGAGRLFESSLSIPHPDVHNQYLSWITSTGAIGLLVAVLMFSPAIWQFFVNPAVFIFLTACAFGFVTDSPMFRKDTTAQFLIMLLFVQSLLGQKRRC